MKTTVKTILFFFGLYYGIASLVWLPTSSAWGEFVSSGPIILIVGMSSLCGCVYSIADELD